MKIRRAIKGDLRQVISLMQKADGRSKEWATDKASKWLFFPKEFRYILIADEKNKFLGFVGIKNFEDDTHEKAKKFIKLNNYSHITWIAVLPGLRGKNIGSKLLKASEKYAIKFKRKGIWLGCRESVIPFYKKNGYFIAGKYYISQKKRNEYIMVKDLK